MKSLFTLWDFFCFFLWGDKCGHNLECWKPLPFSMSPLAFGSPVSHMACKRRTLYKKQYIWSVNTYTDALVGAGSLYYSGALSAWGPDPIRLSNPDVAMPIGYVLRPVVGGWLRRLPQGKETLVPLFQGCTAAARALESWKGLGPE